MVQQIHLVIPAYRESKRLPSFLRLLLAEVQSNAFRMTVRVIDDGSGKTEQTIVQELTTELQEKYPNLLDPELCPKNKGKGHAVYHGWRKAPESDLLAFVDADGSIAPYEVNRVFEEASHTRNTAIFGSRIKMLGKVIDRNFLRHLSGRMYATLMGTLLQANVYDSQCGFKIIPISAFKEIEPKLKEHGFAFDAELLMALAHHKIPVIESPIDWRDTPGSKVHLIRDSIHMVTSLLRIRKRFGKLHIE